MPSQKTAYGTQRQEDEKGSRCERASETICLPPAISTLGLRSQVNNPAKRVFVPGQYAMQPLPKAETVKVDVPKQATLADRAPVTARFKPVERAIVEDARTNDVFVNGTLLDIVHAASAIAEKHPTGWRALYTGVLSEHLVENLGDYVVTQPVERATVEDARTNDVFINGTLLDIAHATSAIAEKHMTAKSHFDGLTTLIDKPSDKGEKIDVLA